MSQHHDKTQTSSLKSVLIAVASAQFMLPFMMAGVGPILPAIGRDLQASAVDLSLINAIYTLSLSIFHLVAGRVGDIIGRKRLFLCGLTLFLCMSALLPFLPNITLFITGRFFQAMGTAVMNTCALAILVSCAPANQLGKVLGLASIGIYLGVSLGPGIAGIVATAFGWRYLFLSVLPVGIIALGLMAFTIKGDWTDSPEAPFDWKGSLLYALGISSVSIGSIWILQGTWAIVLLGVGIGCLGLFIWTELRSDFPILDVRFVFHNRPFILSTLASFINYSSIFGVTFYFSLYLQSIHGLNVLETGMLLSLQPVLQLFASPLGGRLGDRHGAERVATLGIALCGISLLFTALLDGQSSLYTVALIQLVLGAGIGLFASPNTSAIMSSVDAAHRGQASGVVGTARTLGMLLSMVIISLTMNAFLGDAPLGASNASAFLEAMHINVVLFGVMNLFGMFCSLGRMRIAKHPSAA